jgi:aspartyl-tRNA(Asn)/glutamyl-tRNA(Gln) amidotransferase subunit B
MPGVLPVLNKECVNMGILLGLALNCEIPSRCKFDRKQYFYPDLPKAYQTSQYDLPLCYDGHVEFMVGDTKKRVGITRIHIEEDAGKLIHENGDTYVDYNRGGVPLIEIVSKPDIRSIDEAKEYVLKEKEMALKAGVKIGQMHGPWRFPPRDLDESDRAERMENA